MSVVGAELSSPFRGAIAGLRLELTEVEIAGERGKQCLQTTLAVALAVIVALVLRVDAP